MTRKLFMQKLKSELQGGYAADEIRDILSDYEEFFSVGIEEGKSEEQLAVEFGEPREIALDLKLQTKKEPQVKRLTSKVILRMFIAVGLLIFSRIYITGMETAESSFAIIIFTLALWFIMGGGIKSIPPVKYQEAQTKHRTMAILHAVLPIIVLGIYLLILMLGQLDFSVLGIPLDRIGPAVVFVLFVLAVIILFIFACSLYGFYHRSPKYFSLVCHSIACMAFILCVHNWLQSLADPSDFLVGLTRCLIPYGVGVLLVIAVHAYISFLCKGGGE